MLNSATCPAPLPSLAWQLVVLLPPPVDSETGETLLGMRAVANTVLVAFRLVSAARARAREHAGFGIDRVVGLWL